MKHFIGKQILSVVLRQKEGAFEWQHDLSCRFQEDVAPALERLFDRLFDEEHHVLIEKLEIDLGVVTNAEIQSGAWVRLIVNSVEIALSKNLQNADPGSAGARIQLGRFDRWLYFLEHGSLPRFAAVPDAGWRKEILDTLGLHESAVASLRDLLARTPRALARLVLQYPPAFLVHVVELLTGYKQQDLDKALREITSFWKKNGARRWTDSHAATLSPALQALFPDVFGPGHSPDAAGVKAFFKTRWPRAQRELEIRFWRKILQALFVSAYRSAPKGYLQMLFREEPAFRAMIPALLQPKTAAGRSDDLLTVLLREIMPPAQVPAPLAPAPPGALLPRPGVQKPEPAPSSDTTAPAEGWHIDMAGVVLLHPFYVSFFKNRDLLAPGSQRFRDDWACQKAVHLLYYLARGEENPAEHQLTLAKLLCGIPLGQPVDHVSALPDADKNEADALLESAVEHWGALGNTSPAGLREGFLLRVGKLTQAPTGWRLEVERKTIDILLDQLPWGLGVVKTPWMKDMLFVEWR